MLYIGKDVQDRMDILGLTVKEIADKTFLEEDVITAIINNQAPLEEIEEFDFSLLCSVLHCREDFFTNPQVKAKLQDFMNDFAFVTEVLSETK